MSDGTLSSAVLCRPRFFCGLLAVTLLYSLSAHTQDAPASNPLSSRVRGTVINSVTREPVARALVYSPDNRFAAFTDDQGRFEFEFPQTGSNASAPAVYYSSAQLMARKPGFLESGNWTTYNPQSAAAEDITIVLVPEALIVGRVNLPSSNQSDRITVEVYRRGVRDGRPFWASAASATTRSNGEFRVANLAPGTYKIFTDELMDRDPVTFDPARQLYGYPPFYYPTAGDFDSASPIILEAGKTFQAELSPALQPYYPVKVAVTSFPADGGLDVSVALHGHKGPGYSLGYNGDGIGGTLPNGTYSVEATLRQGLQTATGIANITVNGGPSIHASMTVIPNGSIAVNIKDERSANNGQPAGIIRMGRFSREVRADVSLQPADEFGSSGFASLRPPAKPNDKDLALGYVRPGRYWLRVDPNSGYVASAVAGSVDLLRQPLVVGPGGASLPIDIVLRDDGATIEGSIEGMPAATAGDPATASRIVVPATYVYCIPLPDSSGRFTAMGVTRETFQLQQIPPGVYRILAFDRQQGELEYQNPEAMAVYEGRGPVVRLAPGQSEQVRVPLISTRE